MFKFKSLVALSLLGMTFNAVAAQPDQDMSPPKPLDNKVYDSMVGTWQAKGVEMMGKKENQVVKITWGPGHQFIIMDVKATGTEKPKTKYEGIGVFGVDAKGKAKTFWFDSWGAEAMSTGTGDFSDNSLTLTDSNANFKETRSFVIKGNEMTMHAKGTMTKDGKEVPFDITTVYKKK